MIESRCRRTVTLTKQLTSLSPSPRTGVYIFHLSPFCKHIPPLRQLKRQHWLEQFHKWLFFLDIYVDFQLHVFNFWNTLQWIQQCSWVKHAAVSGVTQCIHWCRCMRLHLFQCIVCRARHMKRNMLQSKWLEALVRVKVTQSMLERVHFKCTTLYKYHLSSVCLFMMMRKNRSTEWVY